MYWNCVSMKILFFFIKFYTNKFLQISYYLKKSCLYITTYKIYNEIYYSMYLSYILCIVRNNDEIHTQDGQ